MRIELTDDNGIINNGKPTLVVLVVDGKIRIPYEATKTIQQLYEDVQKLNIPQQPDTTLDENIPRVNLSETNDYKPRITLSNEIEREDIVRCVKKIERDPGSDDDLTVGNMYRVLDIKKKNGIVIQYDVLDDSADMQIRIPVFPEEVELVRKRVIQPKRSVIPDMIKSCIECRTENALMKVGDGRYEGICEKCGAKLVEFLEKKNVSS